MRADMFALENTASENIEARLRYEAAEPTPIAGLCREAARHIYLLREENKRLRLELARKDK